MLLGKAHNPSLQTALKFAEGEIRKRTAPTGSLFVLWHKCALYIFTKQQYPTECILDVT
jgi:hypothetical protein